jgi:hypothetical protein
LGAFTAGSFTLTFEEVFDLCSFQQFLSELSCHSANLR